VYFFIYTVRVKRWTFGFSTLFGGYGSAMRMMMGLFKRKDKIAAEVEEGE
jgi:ATP-binding cassette, subfamily G (WHITE), member 2, SNQ2